jgi:hypothetical protein
MNKPENRFDDEPIHLPEGASYSKDDIEEMQEILDVLKPVPDRDPETAATGRKVFIQQARTMPIPVSPAHEIRHKGWNIFKRKERSPMTVLARVALVLALVIGGSGATAFAAQASMPSDILYPVKLFTEDFRLALTTDPEVEFNLLLELAQERSNEITKMANAGESVPARVNLRLENHLRQATQLAATRSDAGPESSIRTG